MLTFVVQYNNGIPPDSRLAGEQEQWLKDRAKSLGEPEGQAMLAKIKALADVAEKGAAPPFDTTYVP